MLIAGSQFDECSSPFSFLNFCQLLTLAPENVRQELIGNRDTVAGKLRVTQPMVSPVKTRRSHGGLRALRGVWR
jgi:hypothetical protein